MKVLVDTNILLRLSDRSGRDHEAARQALDYIEQNSGQVVIVPQVLYEYWVVATRPLDANGFGLTTSEADRAINKWTQLFRVLLDERGVFTHWRDLVKLYDVKGKLAHDVRLVAAMNLHGVRNILTFNNADFARFSGISVYTPAEILTVNIGSIE